MKPVWATRREGADRLRCSERRIDRLIRAGRLTPHRLGRGIRLSVAELDALLGA